MTHFNWWLDGSIIGVYLLATMVAGIWVRKYVGKVEHFLVAGREMDVYLGIASLAATEFGIVTCMYTAQNGFKYGFAGSLPGITQAIAMFVIGVTGFCIKPLRDSGVMTIPELFHKRYGELVRWLTGLVIVVGGLLNMGVFLRMGGDFLVGVCNLQSVNFGAGFLNAHKLEVMMTILLVGVAVYTILGGMLSVLVTDFLQFVVMSVGLLVVTVLILWQVGWSKLVDTVQTHCGAGGFNPFLNAEMGWSYVVFNVLVCTAATLTWQTSIARVLAAKDTRTGQQVYTRTSFFFICRWLIPGIWGIAALAVLPAGTDSLQAMPKFLSTFIPAGLMGLLIAAMLAADMSTDSSYMLTWGGVLYNDILEPFHKGKWPEKKGLFVNRLIVALIGGFLLFWGLWYDVDQDVWAYLTLTGTIYLASITTLLIACCYWRRANDWGALAAIIFGAIIPVAYLVCEKLPATKAATAKIGPYYSGIATFVLVGLAMVIGSLLKPAPSNGARE